MDLYITGIPPNRLIALRAIRDALRCFDPTAMGADAQAVLNVLDEDGFAIIGQADEKSEQMTNAQTALSRFDCTWLVDPDLDRLARNVRAQRLTAAGATPEQVFAQEAPGEAVVVTEDTVTVDNEQLPFAAYETAMALLAPVDGHPLRAAALAFNLARTTGQVDFYSQVIAALLKTFPWLHGPLVEQGMLQA